MRYSVSVASPNHFQWMADRGDGLIPATDLTLVAALDDRIREGCQHCGEIHGTIRGMVGYSHVTPSSLYVHLVLETPIVWRTLRQVALPVAFEVANKEVVLAQVRSSNKRVRKLLEHSDFKQVVALPGAYQKNDDIIIYRLDREDWRKTHGSGRPEGHPTAL